MKIRHLFLALVILTGCDISDNDITPDESFLKIFDEGSFGSSFVAVDIKQTSDEGYIILARTRSETSNFAGIYLLKADKDGNFEREYTFADTFVHPVGELVNVGDQFYFACMDAVSLRVYLVPVSSTGVPTDPVQVASTVYYPLKIGVDGDRILLHSYDHTSKMSVLSELGTDGSVNRSQNFDIGAGADVEEPIIDHFTRTGRQFPFQVGRIPNGSYYFNGFYNFTFSLVFSDFQGSTPTGVSQGQQDDGGLSSVLPLGGSRFAVSRFNFGDNYLHPNVSIETSSITSSVNMEGNPVPELVDDARIILKSIQVDGQDYLIFAGTTRSQQILLLIYDFTSGDLLGTKYLGFSIPYEVTGFTSTSDDGLAISGVSYVAGRFPRICLFKLSPDEVRDLINPVSVSSE